MALWTSISRQATALSISRFATFKSPPPSYLVHRRGLAGGGGGGGDGEHGGPPKVNFWEDPLSPSKWKEEHFVIVSLTGWGLLFYGGYKYFTRAKHDMKEEKAGEASG